MRRRQIFAQRFKEGQSGIANPSLPAGSGPAVVSPSLPPVSREEEDKLGIIWHTKIEYPILTPATDPTAAPLVRKRGRPKGSKNRARP